MDQLEIIKESPASNVKKFSGLLVIPAKKTTVKNVKTMKRKCFICNAKQTIEDNVHNEGGLQRCSRADTSSELLDKKNIFLDDKNHRHQASAKQLDNLLSGIARDVFAADIFNYQSPS